MLRFLHIGDIHFDSTFYSRSTELRNILRKGIRNSFSSSVEYCIDNGVNGMLIAGDMFDSDNISFETERFLVKQFELLNKHNIDVFYVTGNHDPGDGSIRLGRESLPSNVYIISDDNIQSINRVYGDKRCKIIGVGHKYKGEKRNLIKDFPTKDSDIAHIGLAHAMVAGINKGNEIHDDYLPTTLNDMLSKGYDYWALGHIHKGGHLNNDMSIAYSGNIQGRSFKELGSKGGFLLEIEEGQLNTTFIKLSNIEWHEIDLADIGNIGSYDDLYKFIYQSIDKYVNNEELQVYYTLVRVKLRGYTSLYRELMDEENIKQLCQEVLEDLGLLHIEIRTEELFSQNVADDILDNPYIQHLLEMIDNLGEEDVKQLASNNFINMKIVDDRDKLSFIKETLMESKEEIISLFIGD